MRFDTESAQSVLMQQLPTWFKPVLEYIELMKAYGGSLDGLNENEQAIYKNLFIQTADLATIAMWEKLFKITIRYGDTLEFRRARLIQKFSQIVPYTYFDLRDRLTALYGEDYTLEVDSENCKIKILITSDRYGAVDLLYDLIWDVVPAHLKVIANQEVNNYCVSTAYIGAVVSNTFVQTIPIGGN